MCDRGAALFSYGPKKETVVKTIQQLCLIARSMVSLVHEQPCLNTSYHCALHVGDSRLCAIVSYPFAVTHIKAQKDTSGISRQHFVAAP